MDDSASASNADCAQRLRVLAEPHRLSILKLLLAGPRPVGQISAQLAIEQSLLSHHLRVLRQQGLVKSHRAGRAVLYQLSPEVCLAGAEGIDLGCCALSFAPQPG